MQRTHTHKAVTRRVEAKKLLSCRRQSNYRHNITYNIANKPVSLFPIIHHSGVRLLAASSYPCANVCMTTAHINLFARMMIRTPLEAWWDMGKKFYTGYPCNKTVSSQGWGFTSIYLMDTYKKQHNKSAMKYTIHVYIIIAGNKISGDWVLRKLWFYQGPNNSKMISGLVYVRIRWNRTSSKVFF